MNTKRVYLTAHPSPTHTHTQTYTPCTYNQDEQLELKLRTNFKQTWLTDTQTFLALLREFASC